jgi:His/Glu/Gln/Arg/opine family amino acid ABC transporter permease subunit
MNDFSFWVILSNLLLATRWTVLLSFVAFVCGGLVGLALLFARVSKIPWLEAATRYYIEFFQGTPLLMQLFLFFFGVALLGLEVSPWLAASLALTFWTSAFLTEIWRGCVESLPKGQWEAASLPHCHRTDSRLLGPGDQGHGAGIHHRLRRPDQGRHDAEQCDLPPLPRLLAGRADLLRALLPALLVRAQAGKATQCRSLAFRTCARASYH